MRGWGTGRATGKRLGLAVVLIGTRLAGESDNAPRFRPSWADGYAEAEFLGAFSHRGQAE